MATWRPSWLESVWRDARHALFGLRRSPGFAAVAIVTLALGIGLNTAIFSIVDSLLLRALPVAAPEQLVTLANRSAIEQGFPAGWAFPIWDQVRQRKDAFDGALAWTVFLEQLDLARGGETDPVDGLFVSWNFFEGLGVPPLVGRTFTADEDVLGRPSSRVAVISYGLWQRRFGGAADIVGQTLLVERVPVTVIGVTPPGFLGAEVGRAFEIALPIASAPIIHNDNTWGTPEGFSYLAIMFRLPPKRSIDDATTLVRGMQREIVEAAFPPHPVWGPPEDLFRDPFVLVSASTGTSELRRQYLPSLTTVLVIAALLLLIACVNVAHLMLARTTASQRELLTRVALGAPRWRVVQQTVIESLLLSSLGTAAGLLLAAWGSRAMVLQLSTLFDRIVLDVSLDWRVIGFSAAAMMATALVFGTAPAVRASRVAVGTRTRADSGIRGGFVAAQVALSLVLVIAAGLFIRTFERVASVPLGFDSDRVLVVRINANRARADDQSRTMLYQRLVDAVRTIPGVSVATASLNTPVSSSPIMVMGVDVRGRPAQPENERRVVVNYVTPEYPATYGMSIRAGRNLDARDTQDGLPVAVVNEAFVRQFLRDIDPIGQVITHASPTGAELSRIIVGVVSDAIHQLREEASPTVYHPLAQWEPSGFPQPAQISLSLRSAAQSPMLLAREAAATLTDVDNGLAFSISPLADYVSAARQQERLVAWLSGLVGVLALLLAGIGLHGVMSYAVERQRVEIGIRMALGAQREDVITLTVRHALIMTVSGVAAGLLAAAAVTRYLQTLLFGIEPLDPLTFVAAPAVVVAVALLACYLPARRATSIDPMVALRAE